MGNLLIPCLHQALIYSLAHKMTHSVALPVFTIASVFAVVARMSVVVLNRTISALGLVILLIVGVVIDVRRRGRRLERVSLPLIVLAHGLHLAFVQESGAHRFRFPYPRVSFYTAND